MFNSYGAPTGFGQMSPYRERSGQDSWDDNPEQRQPMQESFMQRQQRVYSDSPVNSQGRVQPYQQQQPSSGGMQQPSLQQATAQTQQQTGMQQTQQQQPPPQQQATSSYQPAQQPYFQPPQGASSWQQQPQLAPAPQPQPTSPQPGPGWTVNAQGGWVPPGYPAGGQTSQTTGLLYNPPNAQIQGQPALQAAIAPQWQQGMGYQAGQLAQFQAPNQQGIEGQQMGALSRMFQNPYSMSQQNVEQLQNQQREQALMMQQQQMDQLGNAAAASGRVGGGWQSGMQRQLGADTMSQILAGNRDVALRKMQQDRADELALQQASNEALNAQMGRATSGYGAQLQGQLGQEGLYQNQGQQNLQRYLGQLGAFGQQYGQNLDYLKGMRGLDINQLYNQGQLDLGNRQLSEQGRQFNSENALGWAGLDQQGQMAMMNAILGMGGGGF